MFIYVYYRHSIASYSLCFFFVQNAIESRDIVFESNVMRSIECLVSSTTYIARISFFFNNKKKNNIRSNSSCHVQHSPSKRRSQPIVSPYRLVDLCEFQYLQPQSTASITEKWGFWNVSVGTEVSRARLVGSSGSFTWVRYERGSTQNQAMGGVAQERSWRGWESAQDGTEGSRSTSRRSFFWW